MIRSIFTALLLAQSVGFAAERVALFNGKNLEGWIFDNNDPKATPESVWSVTDGILVCKGRPPGLMRTLKEYANYELIVEWRWAPDSKPENSGILVHASKPRESFVWPKSIEIQLRHQNAGDFWMIGEKLTVTGAEPQGRCWVKNGESSEKPAGEWNTAKVRCEGDTVSVWINGKLMNEGNGLSVTKGAICLMAEGGIVHFRKVELTPIR